MKAALNGVPSLSILDGWWVEGHIEGVTGWSIGESRLRGRGRGPPSGLTMQTVQSLYQKLENVILPMFYKERSRVSVGDAARHRDQWIFLQYAADGAAVRYGRLYPIACGLRRRLPIFFLLNLTRRQRCYRKRFL